MWNHLRHHYTSYAFFVTKKKNILLKLRKEITDCFSMFQAKNIGKGESFRRYRLTLLTYLYHRV